MAILNASDIIKFAIKIEETGEKFYTKLAEKVEDEETRNLFLQLAKEEVWHRNIFEKMIQNLKEYLNLPANLPEQEQDFLNYFTDRLIFDMKKLNNIKEQLKDLNSALDFAIQRELDSILYYSELKRFAQISQQTVIDKIIDQERIHFLRLSKLKEKFQS